MLLDQVFHCTSGEAFEQKNTHKKANKKHEPLCGIHVLSDPMNTN